MKELKTRTKTFDSDYCVEMQTPKRLMIRIKNSNVNEVSSVFHNPIEVAEVSFRGRAYRGYTNCNVVRDEGTQIFVMLS